MISGNRVSHINEAVSSFDARNWLDFICGILEEWWVVHVGRFFIPFVLSAFWGIESLPHLASLKDVVVSRSEHFWLDDSICQLGNLITSRPDIAEEDWLSLFVVT